MPTNTDLAKIHIAKKELGLSDEAYRDMLHLHFGVSSAKDLNPRQVLVLLNKFRARGWTSKRPSRGKKPFAGSKTGAPRNRARLLAKIEAHLAERGAHWNYAHAIAEKICKVERVEWCDDEQLWKLVCALEYDSKRHHGPAQGVTRG